MNHQEAGAEAPRKQVGQAVLDVGHLEGFGGGGYKIEGSIYAMGDRHVIHDVIEQLMDRIDEGACRRPEGTIPAER